MLSQLENPVWHALIGPQQHLTAAINGVGAGEVGGVGGVGASAGAAWFDPEVAIWHGAPELDVSGWRTMGEVIEPRAVVVVMRKTVSEPAEADWQVLGRRHLLQLIAPDEPTAQARRDLAHANGELLENGDDLDRVVELGATDVPDMLALTKLTEPGPFLSRTIEMGRYLGVHRAGRLVAMAGERLNLDGATEISGVCTHPDALGEGLAGRLTLAVAAGIQARGKVGFLHVDRDNHRALGLYQHLGFQPHHDSHVIAARLAKPTEP